MTNQFTICLLLLAFTGSAIVQNKSPKPQMIVTTDGEIDDECSMVRFLLYANEWDIEGIATSSSQYYWQGHNWAGDDWMEPYLDAYAKVYPNLIKHDPGYPTPEYLRKRTVLGNVKAEGEMEEVTLPVKPRVLISTDIGGTDPDDNQSMIHLLMYSDMFDIEGIVSSPSYGDGNKKEILRAIDLYEKDLHYLKKHRKGFPSADHLRSVTKQGRRGGAPYAGYASPTEGSEWIIKCAKKESERPLWVLVWGGLDDVAQALHDAPEIQRKIKVYWIGGPNKKWSTNSYAYIAANFPDLWFIEANAAYRGFFSNTGVPDRLHTDSYYEHYIRGAGLMGKDFKKYYEGRIKMGDTPSLLYIMDGDPNDPSKDSWGGSFEKIDHSGRIVFHRNTTMADTVPVYSIMEFHIEGPEINIPPDSACFTLTVAGQNWEGFYLGKRKYAVRYAPKQVETLTYTITSDVLGFPKQNGAFVVGNIWPGAPRATDYKLGANWYTDRSDPELFDGKWQGAKTVLKWRNQALLDWAQRWEWLRD